MMKFTDYLSVELSVPQGTKKIKEKFWISAKNYIFIVINSLKFFA